MDLPIAARDPGAKELGGFPPLDNLGQPLESPCYQGDHVGAPVSFASVLSVSNYCTRWRLRVPRDLGGGSPARHTFSKIMSSRPCYREDHCRPPPSYIQCVQIRMVLSIAPRDPGARDLGVVFPQRAKTSAPRSGAHSPLGEVNLPKPGRFP